MPAGTKTRTIMTDNYCLGNDSSKNCPPSPRYCLQCMSEVKAEQSGRIHMAEKQSALSPPPQHYHHASHPLIKQSEAVSRIKHQLQDNMDNINAYFYQLHQFRCELRQFEEAHELSKKSIQSTATDLITKIKEHETRMLDELETHRELEYKRIGLNDSNASAKELENNLVNLQKTFSDISAMDDNSDVFDSYKSQREHINTLMLEAQKVDSLIEKVGELRRSVFSSVRCNTAFGTLDITQRKHNALRHSVSVRKVSMVNAQTVPASLVHLNNEQDTNTQHSNQGIDSNTSNRARKLSLQVNMTAKANSPCLRHSPVNFRDVFFSSGSSSDACSEVSEPLELLWSVESEGRKLGQINCPSDVSFQSDGTLIVCDRGNSRLQVFNKSGEAIKVIGENKIKPCRIDTGKNGQIVVSDSKENNVCIYDKKGNCQSVLGKKLFKTVSPFKTPCGVAVRPGKQFIASDIERNDVAIYSSDGKVIKELGKEGGDNIEFKKPSYITTGADGRIYVSDNLKHCVRVFDAEGKYLFQCVLGGNTGSNSDLQKDTNYLKYPNGVCCDEQGNIYVADWGSHTVSRFNRNGEFERHVLTRDDGIYHPAGVAIFDNQLAVCSYSDSHSSVQVFLNEP